MVAYAVQIKPENFKAIASEKPHFNLESTVAWLETHGDGYFLRDEDSVLDCEYFDPTVFFEMYRFRYDDPSVIFRRVIKI